MSRAAGTQHRVPSSASTNPDLKLTVHVVGTKDEDYSRSSLVVCYVIVEQVEHASSVLPNSPLEPSSGSGLLRFSSWLKNRIRVKNSDLTHSRKKNYFLCMRSFSYTPTQNQFLQLLHEYSFKCVWIFNFYFINYHL